MSDELNDELESTTEPTEEVVKTDDAEETAVDAETESDDELDLAALQEKNKKLFERAKKAEAEAKLLKAERIKAEEHAKAAKLSKAETPKPSEKQDGLTSMDTIALIGAKVTEKEDIEEVLDYARLKGIAVADALRTNVVKTILKERAEQRQTAEASNTGAARRGVSKLTAEQIVSNASAGNFPDDPEEIATARMSLKLKK